MKLYKSVVCTVITACGFVGGSAFAIEAGKQVGDPSYAGEVLASAPLKSGKGSMEIVRTSEDGIDGVAISVTAPIGTRIAAGSDLSRLPTSEHIKLRFYELTGKRLTADALDALKEVDDIEAASVDDEAARADFATANNEYASSIGCTRYNDGHDVQKHHVFYRDCHGNGAIKQTAYDVEDVCLLVAAINGDNTMQLSYRGLGGKFYKNFEANVKQGHYRAVLLKTNIKRTRKGQIFNASISDYSRLEMLGYNGWGAVIPPYPNGDCVHVY